MNSTATSRFHKLCLSTLVAVYILVFVGGVVRSTGSGMGCPDWPTCFGSWVPPTSVDQLPVDYKAQYAAYRDKKNQKFAKYLKGVGLNSTAEKILKDDSILIESDFNPAKTWVEYVNRLVGVIIGLFIIALFVASWKTRNTNPKLFKGSLATLILVIIQGWFGSIVVSTNLTSWTITLHMFLALLIVAILVWLLVRSDQANAHGSKGIKGLLLGGMAVLLVQIFLGTQVRQALDKLSAMPRETWIDQAGINFIIHRSFSWVIWAILIVLWLKLRKTSAEKSLTLMPFLLILSSLVTGFVMAYWAVPPFLQPIHLLLAVVTFGWFYQVYLQANTKATSLFNE